MTKKELNKLRFPIGPFEKPEKYSKEIIEKYIQIISHFPAKLKTETSHLNEKQLNTPYRPQGWTIKQVVHHCADSHINSFVRFKLALTEDNPTIKPYQEAKWAELPDSLNMAIEPSLMLLEGLHNRWTVLLNALTKKELERNFFHPEYEREISLQEIMGFYSWHCEHHLAHITQLKKLNNWK